MIQSFKEKLIVPIAIQHSNRECSLWLAQISTGFYFLLQVLLTAFGKQLKPHFLYLQISFYIRALFTYLSSTILILLLAEAICLRQRKKTEPSSHKPKPIERTLHQISNFVLKGFEYFFFPFKIASWTYAYHSKSLFNKYFIYDTQLGICLTGGLYLLSLLSDLTICYFIVALTRKNTPSKCAYSKIPTMYETWIALAVPFVFYGAVAQNLEIVETIGFTYFLIMFSISFFSTILYFSELPFYNKDFEKWLAHAHLNLLLLLLVFRIAPQTSALKLTIFVVPLGQISARRLLKHKNSNFDYFDRKWLKSKRALKWVLVRMDSPSEIHFEEGVLKRHVKKCKSETCSCKSICREYELKFIKYFESQQQSNHSLRRCRSSLSLSFREKSRTSKVVSLGDAEEWLRATVEETILLAYQRENPQNFFGKLAFVFWLFGRNLVFANLFALKPNLYGKKKLNFKQKLVLASIRRLLKMSLSKVYENAELKINRLSNAEKEISKLGKKRADTEYVFRYKDKIRDFSLQILEFITQNRSFVTELKSQSACVSKIDKILENLNQTSKKLKKDFWNFHSETKNIEVMHIGPMYLFLVHGINLHKSANLLLKIYNQRIVAQKSSFSFRSTDISNLSLFKDTIHLVINSAPSEFGAVVAAYGNLSMLNISVKRVTGLKIDDFIATSQQLAHREAMSSYLDNKIDSYLWHPINSFVKVYKRNRVFPCKYLLKVLPSTKGEMNFILSTRLLLNDTKMYIVLDTSEEICCYSQNMDRLVPTKMLKTGINIRELSEELYDKLFRPLSKVQDNKEHQFNWEIEQSSYLESQSSSSTFKNQEERILKTKLVFEGENKIFEIPVKCGVAKKNYQRAAYTNKIVFMTHDDGVPGKTWVENIRREGEHVNENIKNQEAEQSLMLNSSVELPEVGSQDDKIGRNQIYNMKNIYGSLLGQTNSPNKTLGFDNVINQINDQKQLSQLQLTPESPFKTEDQTKLQKFGTFERIETALGLTSLPNKKKINQQVSLDSSKRPIPILRSISDVRNSPSPQKVVFKLDDEILEEENSESFKSNFSVGAQNLDSKAEREFLSSRAINSPTPAFKKVQSELKKESKGSLSINCSIFKIKENSIEASLLSGSNTYKKYYAFETALGKVPLSGKIRPIIFLQLAAVTIYIIYYFIYMSYGIKETLAKITLASDVGMSSYMIEQETSKFLLGAHRLMGLNIGKINEGRFRNLAKMMENDDRSLSIVRKGGRFGQRNLEERKIKLGKEVNIKKTDLKIDKNYRKKFFKKNLRNRIDSIPNYKLKREDSKAGYRNLQEYEFSKIKLADYDHSSLTNFTKQNFKVIGRNLDSFLAIFRNFTSKSQILRNYLYMNNVTLSKIDQDGDILNYTISMYQGQFLILYAELQKLIDLPSDKFIPKTKDYFLRFFMLNALENIAKNSQDVRNHCQKLLDQVKKLILIRNFFFFLLFFVLKIGLIFSSLLTLFLIRKVFVRLFTALKGIDIKHLQEREAQLFYLKNSINKLRQSGYFKDLVQQKRLIIHNKNEKGRKPHPRLKIGLHCFKLGTTFLFLVAVFFCILMSVLLFSLISGLKLYSAQWIVEKELKIQTMNSEQWTLLNSIYSYAVVGNEINVKGIPIEKFFENKREILKNNSRIFDLFDTGNVKTIYLKKVAKLLNEVSYGNLCSIFPELKSDLNFCSKLDSKFATEGMIPSIFRTNQYTLELLQRIQQLSPDSVARILSNPEFIEWEYTFEMIYSRATNFLIINLSKELNTLIEKQIGNVIYVPKFFVFTIVTGSLVMLLFIYWRLKKDISRIFFSFQVLSINTILENPGVRLMFVSIFGLNQRYF